MPSTHTALAVGDTGVHPEGAPVVLLSPLLDALLDASPVVGVEALEVDALPVDEVVTAPVGSALDVADDSELPPPELLLPSLAPPPPPLSPHDNDRTSSDDHDQGERDIAAL